MAVLKSQQTITVGSHLTVVSPSKPTKEYIQQFLASKLASIRACTFAEIQEEIAVGGGNLEMDSPEAVVAINALERELGRKLVGPRDLRRDQLTALDTVTDLIMRQLENTDAGKGKRIQSLKRIKTAEKP